MTWHAKKKQFKMEYLLAVIIKSHEIMLSICMLVMSGTGNCTGLIVEIGHHTLFRQELAVCAHKFTLGVSS